MHRKPPSSAPLSPRRPSPSTTPDEHFIIHIPLVSSFASALMNCAIGQGRGEILQRDSPAFLSLPRILTKCTGDKDGWPCLPAAQSDPALRRALNLKRWLLTASHSPAPDSRINAINFDGCGPVCSVAATGGVVLFFFSALQESRTMALWRQINKLLHCGKTHH